MRGLLRPAPLHPYRSSDDRVALAGGSASPPLELRVEVRCQLERVDPDALPERLLADFVLRVRSVEMAVGAKRNGPSVARLLRDPRRSLPDLEASHSDVRCLRSRRRAAGAARVPANEREEGRALDAGIALPERHRRFFFTFGAFLAGTDAIAVFSSAEVAFVFLRDASN